MARRQQIIIHAGFHRCASTATQNLLRRHRAAIEASGIKLLLRQDLQGRLTGRQLRLLYRYRDGSALGKMRLSLVKRMLRRIQADRIIISEELLLGLMPGVRDAGFYPGFPNFLAAMKRLSDDFDIQLRFIVRRPDRFLESAYAFRVPRGLRCAFPEFVARIGAENVRWFPLLQAVVAAGFGDTARFAVLEALPRPGAGAAVLELLGLEKFAEGPVKFGRGNPSLTAEELRSLLGANVQTCFTDGERAAFLSACQEDNAAFLAHPMISAPPTTWD